MATTGVERSAALVPLADHGLIRVGGADRVRFLHGQLTAKVEGRAVGEGCQTLMLDVKGHVLAHLELLVCPDEIWLLCPGAQLQAVGEGLGRSVVAEDVQIDDGRPTHAILAVEGPDSGPSLAGAIGRELPALGARAHAELVVGVRGYVHSWSGVGGLWLIGDVDLVAGLRRHLEHVGVSEAAVADVERLRIERGIPRYGVDVDVGHLPQETGLMDAVAFGKGCYRGQEIVERIRSRGQVNRVWSGLRIDGPPPAHGAQLLSEDGATVGVVTSACRSPRFDGSLGLGTVRRAHSAPSTGLSLEGNAVEVVGLPFVTD